MVHWFSLYNMGSIIIPYMGLSLNGGRNPPKPSHFNRVFHLDFHPKKQQISPRVLGSGHMNFLKCFLFFVAMGFFSHDWFFAPLGFTHSLMALMAENGRFFVHHPFFFVWNMFEGFFLSKALEKSKVLRWDTWFGGWNAPCANDCKWLPLASPWTHHHSRTDRRASGFFCAYFTISVPFSDVYQGTSIAKSSATQWFYSSMFQ